MKLARSIGIAVDHRRRNRSLESLQVRCRPGLALRPAAVAALCSLAASAHGAMVYERGTPMHR